MICSTVTEKLDRELFTTSILFTFFQTFPGGLERDVTMARHIGFSFANICSSAQALVYDSLLLKPYIAVKTGYSLTSITWPYRGLRCRPIEFTCFLKLSADKLLVFNWSQTQLQGRFFEMVTSLLFEVKYKCINGSFAFSLGYIYILKFFSLY